MLVPIAGFYLEIRKEGYLPRRIRLRADTSYQLMFSLQPNPLGDVVRLPTVVTIERRRLQDDAGERKVFVHCAMNHRVSCFVALYGEAKLGWTREQADGLVAKLWHPNDVWRAFMERVRERLT